MKNPLDFPIRNPAIKWFVEWFTGLGILKAWYEDWIGQPVEKRDGAAFLEYTLAKLGATLAIGPADRLKDIPASGPIIFISNHPLGGLDGMLLTQKLLEVRPDLKVLTNEHLQIFPEFADLFIGVDVLSDDARRTNSTGIRHLGRHLDKGGAALIFPGKIVSQISLPSLKIADIKWTPMVARLASRYHATCVPIFVKARNPMTFYLAKFIHRRLRTALLIRAMLSQRGKTIQAVIGMPVPAEELANFADVGAATDYLRMSCDILDNDATVAGANPDQIEINPDVDLSLLRERIDGLSEYLQLQDGPFRVYCAPYAELGCVMEQIAICRERTFRAVDAGSGEEIDRNRFDPYYWHLFVWDEEKLRVAGGYRLERADRIAELHGIDSMCSQSVYRYDRKFISELGKAIELSRSFVTPEYQLHPKILDLLWKGIARFVVANPGYHTLFGPVSIPPKYSLMARSFLADAFLFHYSANRNLRRQVLPVSPLDVSDRPWSKELVAAASNIPFINRLLGRIDDGKSIPVLIRRYLAFNGKFIAFGVNDGFNHSLDGLIVVDLRDAPEKYLKRYLGVSEIREIHGLVSEHKQVV